LQRRKVLEDDLSLDSKLHRSVEDLEAFFELGAEGEDVAKEIGQELARLEAALATIEPGGATRWSV
jgi:hypothetical protein